MTGEGVHVGLKKLRRSGKLVGSHVDHNHGGTFNLVVIVVHTINDGTPKGKVLSSVSENIKLHQKIHVFARPTDDTSVEPANENVDDLV